MIHDQQVTLEGKTYEWRYYDVLESQEGWEVAAWCPDDCWEWTDLNHTEISGGVIRAKFRDAFLSDNVPSMLAQLNDKEYMRFACLLSMMGVARKQVSEVNVDDGQAEIIRVIARYVGVQNLVSLRGLGTDTIYVIKLHSDVRNLPGVRDDNPKYSPDKDCVYVGMTGRSPELRFQQHRDGIHSSRFPRQFGERLIPELTSGLHNLKKDDAEKIEGKLAEELRRQGYTVTGGH